MGFVLRVVLLVQLPMFALGALFGADDREAITESSESFHLAESVAVSVLSSMYDVRPDGRFDILHDNLNAYMCPSERYSSDQSISWACTGFLVGPDLLATAGHCMVNFGESKNERESYCEAFSWLFGYHKSDSGRDPLTGVHPDNFYHCKEIIYAINETEAPFRDFALVRLDRVVKGRKPLQLATTALTKSAKLRMIGFPLGSPAKLSQNAKILHSDPEKMNFLTNLDAFAGNSGSPVFNAQDEVTGLLVAGTPSAGTIGPKRQCERYNRCDDNGRNCEKSEADDVLIDLYGVPLHGSEIQRINDLKDLVDEHSSK